MTESLHQTLLRRKAHRAAGIDDEEELRQIRSGELPGFQATTPAGRRLAAELAAQGQRPVRDRRVAQYSAEAAARVPAAQAALGTISAPTVDNRTPSERLAGAQTRLATRRRVGESQEAFENRIASQFTEEPPPQPVLDEILSQEFIAPKLGIAPKVNEKQRQFLIQHYGVDNVQDAIMVRRQMQRGGGSSRLEALEATGRRIGFGQLGEHLDGERRAVARRPVRVEAKSDDIYQYSLDRVDPKYDFEELDPPAPEGQIYRTSDGLLFRNDEERFGQQTPMLEIEDGEFVHRDIALERAAENDIALKRRFAKLRAERQDVFESDHFTEPQKRQLLAQSDKALDALARTVVPRSERPRETIESMEGAVALPDGNYLVPNPNGGFQHIKLNDDSDDKAKSQKADDELYLKVFDALTSKDAVDGSPKFPTHEEVTARIAQMRGQAPPSLDELVPFTFIMNPDDGSWSALDRKTNQKYPLARTPAEAMKLPKGTTFVTGDGRLKVRP